MNSSKTLILIWLIGSLVAVFFAMQFESAALFNGDYVPVSNDSFYHARRILDAAIGERGFYQFDERIYVPEGAWLNWPWAYDYLVAGALSLAMLLAPGTDPMAFLAHVPVAWLLVNFALLALIVEELDISPLFAAIAVLAFALLPLTQALHGLGVIDHHFIEWTFVLATLLFGMRWFRRGGVRDAVLLGTTLGFATAFHNGLFILQVPVLAGVFAAWLRRDLPDPRTLRALSITILLATLLACLPSEPFREGRFEFWLHSWFHVYVAFGSAVAIAFPSFVEFSRRNLGLFIAMGVVLLVPLAGKLLTGAAFVSGELEIIDGITEVKSPIERLGEANGVRWVSSYYSGLLVLAPILLVVFAIQSWQETDTRRRYMQIFAVFGVLLLLAQYRLHPFGSWVLVVGTVWLADEAQRSGQLKLVPTAAATVILFALALVAPVRNVLTLERPLGLSLDYAVTHTLFESLAGACDERPGAVLSYRDDGHYVSYHSECSVLTNNFLMTPQHARLGRDADVLLAMSPEEFRKAAPHVDYLFVRLYNIFEYTSSGRRQRSFEEIAALNAKLFSALALSDEIPEGYRLIDERRVGTERDFAYARIFEVRHD